MKLVMNRYFGNARHNGLSLMLECCCELAQFMRHIHRDNCVCMSLHSYNYPICVTKNYQARSTFIAH